MRKYHGRIHNKSTATTKKNYSTIEGRGKVRSNDTEIGRELTNGLVSSVNHANEIVYKIHKKG